MEISRPRWLRWPSDPSRTRFAFGADYNPDQWPREVWDDDVRAMQKAGVNIVSLAVFSWAQIQPRRDEFEFGWLDEIMDLLHAGGIAVDLATATASPPPWLTADHPEILPVDRDGRTLWPGARQHWRPTSPVFRKHALHLVRALAARYAEHPALAAWHVSNELGCHNLYDYSDDAATAFRAWLRTRYGTVDALNQAWGTAFWSQRYSDWSQILPPRLAPTFANPTQELDFKRFSSDALLEHLRAERDLLYELTPDVPVATSFLVMGGSRGLNYADWAQQVDFVANGHYTWPDPQARDELSFSANLTGNLAGGRPWFLMEHPTSAVNWQPVNVPKMPGELARDSLTHVAYGADAVCFFQWRQAAAGAEKYYSAMLPHAGEDSAVFRAVTDLGRRLHELAPVAGTPRTPAQVAIVFDWESWWAVEQDCHSSGRVRYRQEALDWYTALLDLGIRVDVVPVIAPVERYRVLIAPMLHLVPRTLAQRLVAFVHAGGHLVTTYFSGIVDENDHVWPGGYPGALRDLLGIRIEAFAPLLDGDSVELDNGTTGTLWTDHLTVTDDATEILAGYETGDQAGRPAITRRPVGAGTAAYVSTRLDPEDLCVVVPELLAKTGVRSELPPSLRGHLELAVRGGHRFLLNRTESTVKVHEAARQLLPALPATIPPFGVLVVSDQS